VQAGILEDRRPDSGVRAAVLADAELTERQKQVLLEIYESFRKEPPAIVANGIDADGAGASGGTGGDAELLEITGPDDEAGDPESLAPDEASLHRHAE